MSKTPESKQQWRINLSGQNPGIAIDILVSETGISKSKLKDAMTKGAVQLQRAGTCRYLRRAQSRLRSGDVLIFNYNPKLLNLVAAQARRLWQCQDYSLWYKPAGLLAQGNEYGDHASLLRQAELADPLRKPVYLIHRLDREAKGLMLIAHSRNAASRLSRLFQQQQVSKQYAVTVLGRPPEKQATIDLPLDGKPALTHYELIDYDAQSNTSHLRVRIMTGRKHQIRRHLEMLGHPVMGDPRYGQGNKTTGGLQLTATHLSFDCPLSGMTREFDLSLLKKNDPDSDIRY